MERYFWRAFNAGVRVLGIVFVAGGVLIVLSGLGVIPTDEAPAGGATTYVVMTPGGWWLVGIVTIIIGIPLLFVRSYRPDLGDGERMVDPSEARGNSKRARTWLTGQPK